MSWWSFAWAFTNDITVVSADVVADDDIMEAVVDETDEASAAAIDEMSVVGVDDEPITEIEETTDVGCC